MNPVPPRRDTNLIPILMLNSRQSAAYRKLPEWRRREVDEASRRAMTEAAAYVWGWQDALGAEPDDEAAWDFAMLRIRRVVDFELELTHKLPALPKMHAEWSLEMSARERL